MKNTYKLFAYIGEEFKEKGFAEMEYDGFEDVIIFRDSNEDNEIWLNPNCLDEMSEEIKEFSEKIKNIRNGK